MYIVVFVEYKYIVVFVEYKCIWYKKVGVGGPLLIFFRGEEVTGEGWGTG